jgi:hypothetical protein
MMVFFGILIKMVLRPTPGQSYVVAWKEPEWHPYTRIITLCRFQQIQSVLRVNDNTKMATSNDSLFKVRPVLNCLKLTFPAYLELGDNLVLDEASISSRSKYGGSSFLIIQQNREVSFTSGFIYCVVRPPTLVCAYVCTRETFVIWQTATRLRKGFGNVIPNVWRQAYELCSQMTSSWVSGKRRWKYNIQFLNELYNV